MRRGASRRVSLSCSARPGPCHRRGVAPHHRGAMPSELHADAAREPKQVELLEPDLARDEDWTFVEPQAQRELVPAHPAIRLAGAEPEAERRVEPAPRLEPLHEAGEDDRRPGAPPAIAEPVTLPQHPDLERLERPRRLAAQVAHRRPLRTEVDEGPAPGDDPDMLL